MNINKLGIFLGILLFAIQGVAQTTQESVAQWFAEGNTAYNEGNYEQALEAYGNIVASDLESASLYYNMGNTYYKMKEYAKAILYYEKALKLDPGNEDIKANLEIANLAVVDKITPIPQSFIARWWNSLKSLFSADGWAWMSVSAFALLLLCLFIFLMARRSGLRKVGFFIGLVALLVLAIAMVFAVEKTGDLKHQDEAIVMTPTVTVKSSPTSSSIDLFVLHEGAKVRVLDEADGWNKIKIADGSVGWLPVGEVAPF